MRHDEERTKRSQKNANYSGCTGFIRGTWILWDENKSDIETCSPSLIPARFYLLEELINIGLEGMRMPMQINAKNGLDFFYQFTEMLFLYAKEKPFTAKMFVFMGNAVWAEDIPERLRKLAASVDTIAYSRSRVEAGQRDGSIREGDVMALSNMYWCAIHGIMEQFALRPEIPLPEAGWVVGMLRNSKGEKD